MCEYCEDGERAWLGWDGIHYYNGDFQPFIPELRPPKPEAVISIRMVEVNEIYKKVLKDKIPKIFETDDIFYRFLK